MLAWWFICPETVIFFSVGTEQLVVQLSGWTVLLVPVVASQALLHPLIALILTAWQQRLNHIAQAAAPELLASIVQRSEAAAAKVDSSSLLHDRASRISTAAAGSQTTRRRAAGNLARKRRQHAQAAESS